MRRVVWVDRSGMRHVSTIRDNDPDSMAPYGIRHDPPDLGSLDWPQIEQSLVDKGLHYQPDETKAVLYNALLDRGLSTWSDVMNQQSGITAAVNSAAVKLYSRADHQKIFSATVRPMIVRLYRSLSSVNMEA